MCTSQRPGIRVPAFEIDHLRVAGAARLSAWQDGADAAILDQHSSIRLHVGLDAVDQVRVGKDCLHDGLFRLKFEILGSNSGTEAQICVADKRSLLFV
jgi:hypothetical protein